MFLVIRQIGDKIMSIAEKKSRKSVTWSAVPDAPKLVYVGMRLRGAAAPEEPMTYDST